MPYNRYWETFDRFRCACRTFFAELDTFALRLCILLAENLLIFDDKRPKTCIALISLTDLGYSKSPEEEAKGGHAMIHLLRRLFESLVAGCRSRSHLLLAVLAASGGLSQWSGGVSANDSTSGAPRAFLTVALTEAETSERIRSAVAAMRDPALHARYRNAYVFGSPFFPPDDDLRAFDMLAEDAVAQGLGAWLALPTSDRRLDLWISPDVDYYWSQSLKSGDQSVEFSANFLVHLTPIGSATTEVTVLQLRQRIRLGRRFRLFGRVGPGSYWDIRPVNHAPQATLEVLDFLAQVLRR